MVAESHVGQRRSVRIRDDSSGFETGKMFVIIFQQMLGKFFSKLFTEILFNKHEMYEIFMIFNIYIKERWRYIFFKSSWRDHSLYLHFIFISTFYFFLNRPILKIPSGLYWKALVPEKSWNLFPLVRLVSCIMPFGSNLCHPLDADRAEPNWERDRCEKRERE